MMHSGSADIGGGGPGVRNPPPLSAESYFGNYYIKTVPFWSLRPLDPLPT